MTARSRCSGFTQCIVATLPQRDSFGLKIHVTNTHVDSASPSVGSTQGKVHQPVRYRCVCTLTLAECRGQGMSILMSYKVPLTMLTWRDKHHVLSHCATDVLGLSGRGTDAHRLDAKPCLSDGQHSHMSSSFRGTACRWSSRCWLYPPCCSAACHAACWACPARTPPPGGAPGSLPSGVAWAQARTRLHTAAPAAAACAVQTCREGVWVLGLGKRAAENTLTPIDKRQHVALQATA
jgi:hypothetical protein